MPQFQESNYLQHPPTTASQSVGPSPLAMLAATCRKIGDSLPSPSGAISVTNSPPPERVSPTPAYCYPSPPCALTFSYGSVAALAVELALYLSTSPPAACASVSPPTIWPSSSRTDPSMSPSATCQSTSPPLLTASPPLPPYHQPVSVQFLHDCHSAMSAQPGSQCCYSCNCSPSVTHLQHPGYPMTWAPYPSHGFSSLGPIRHRQSPPSYTPYPTNEVLSSSELATRRFSRCECSNCLRAEQSSEPTTRRRQHICHLPRCGKVYAKTSHLKAHMRGHAGKRDFVCRWMNCGKSFTRSDELQRHLRTHTGVKQYACGECGKRFMRSDHLSKHQTTHSVRGYTTSGHPVEVEEFIDVLN